MSPRSSPETGKARVLYIGEPVGGPGPYRFMVQDPFLDMSPVQATTAWYEIEVIRRSLRLYMPRNYRELTTKLDIVVLSDANRDLFSGQVLRWFSDGVLEAGMGLLMTGGRESFGAYFSMPDWTPTSVGLILPVESTASDKGPTARVEILIPENLLIASLPWASIGRHGIFYGFNPVREREGSEVVAQLVADPGLVNPFLVWWDVGEGRTFAMTSDWTPAGANAFIEWEFYQDYPINLVLFIANLEVPQDPILVHRVRARLDEYHLQRDFLLSLIEFISRFGANPGKVEERLSEADSGLKAIEETYMRYEFDSSLSIAEGLVQSLNSAVSLALKLKDQALLWIYVVEWAAFMGTGLLSGIFVWVLMVRRRLYREVVTTRAR